MLGKWAALNCFFLAFSAAPAASSEAMRGRWEQGKERNGDAGGARACPRPRTVAANPRASAGHAHEAHPNPGGNSHAASRVAAAARPTASSRFDGLIARWSACLSHPL